MVVSYETRSFRRSFLLEGDKLIKASSFRKHLEKGEVYLGKVEERVPDLGFIVDLGGFKGLCQDKLVLGERRLFEVKRYDEGKYPLLTSQVGFVGESIILRGGETSYSRGLAPSYRKLLSELGLQGVYFRRNASKVPTRLIKEEYNRLTSLRENPAKELGLVYRPFFKEEGDPFYFRELESQILALAGGKLKEDGISLYFDNTRAGLVIDVNGLGPPELVNRKAWELIERSLILMNVGGLVMVDFLGQGQGYKGPGSLTKEGVLVRSYPQRGLNLFKVDKELLEKDYEFLKDRLNEENL